MGLSDLVQRIAADAEEESARILESGRDRADEIRARAEREAAQQRDALLDEARLQAGRDTDQRLAEARLKARNLLLAAKREALDEVEELARSLVMKLPDERFAELMARAVALRARGDERVVIGEGAVGRLGDGFVGRVNELVAAAGKQAALRPADRPAPLGAPGAMLLGDGTEDLVTPDALVAEARTELEPEIARTLFEGVEL